MTESGTDPGEQKRSLPQWPRSRHALLIGLGLAVVAAVAFAIFAVVHSAGQDQLSSTRPTGIPASVSTSLADTMGLSPMPQSPAPNFTLVDQHGKTLTLRSFRGRAVVLEFMDPHCVDICPIVSQEFVDAYRDLGKAASHAVFIAVNVNRYHLSVADVAAFSNEHGLDAIQSWHFFTGTQSQLAAIWHRYGVEVEAPSPTADIIHSSFVYFIDPQGRERFLANPTDDHTAKGVAYLPAASLASWGQGIALVVRNLAQ